MAFWSNCFLSAIRSRERLSKKRKEEKEREKMRKMEERKRENRLCVVYQKNSNTANKIAFWSNCFLSQIRSRERLREIKKKEKGKERERSVCVWHISRIVILQTKFLFGAIAFFLQ